MQHRTFSIMTMLIEAIYLLFLCEWISTEQTSLVYLKLLESRSEDGLKVVKIDPHLTLNLERSDILYDNLEVSNYENGNYVLRDIPSKIYSEHLRQDKTHLSSVMLYETAHGLLMTGILNSSHVIHPYPLLERDSKMSGVAHKISKAVSASSSIKKAGNDPFYKDAVPSSASAKVYQLEIAIIVDQWAQKNIDKRARTTYEAYYLTRRTKRGNVLEDYRLNCGIPLFCLKWWVSTPFHRT
uniref:Putative tick metalloprotease n=1 Tax=Ixodes ricinus TaxID=34613 RepID=V5GYV0_IXORI